MILPAPLLVTLKEGLDARQKAGIIDQMHDIEGVIHALPRSKEQDPGGRQVVVIYSGGNVAEALRRLEAVAAVGEAPAAFKRPNRFPGFH